MNADAAHRIQLTGFIGHSEFFPNRAKFYYFGVSVAKNCEGDRRSNTVSQRSENFPRRLKMDRKYIFS